MSTLTLGLSTTYDSWVSGDRPSLSLEKNNLGHLQVGLKDEDFFVLSQATAVDLLHYLTLSGKTNFSTVTTNIEKHDNFHNEQCWSSLRHVTWEVFVDHNNEKEMMELIVFPAQYNEDCNSREVRFLKHDFIAILSHFTQ
jgi:hypothetical protein